MKNAALTILLVLFFATFAFAKVNINTADIAELQTIKGVGIAKAESIVKDRKENGPYATVNDLTRVKGIGDKMLAKIKDEVTTK